MPRHTSYEEWTHASDCSGAFNDNCSGAARATPHRDAPQAWLLVVVAAATAILLLSA